MGRLNNLDTIIHIVKQQIGKPYVWGATGPNSFDCSGLFYYAMVQTGIPNPPRTTYDELASSIFEQVSVNNLQPGDLVFPHDGHVLMYLDDPNGKFIHAPHTGDVVKYVDSYNIVKARRLISKYATMDSAIIIEELIGYAEIINPYPSGYKIRSSAGSSIASSNQITLKVSMRLPIFEKKTLGTTDWVRIEQGWIQANTYKGGTNYLKFNNTYSTVIEGDPENNNFQNGIDMEAFNSYYEKYMESYKDDYYKSYVESVKTNLSKDDYANAFLKQPRGILGMPYQYNKYVDRRMKDSIFGRKYAEKIVTKMPLLLISPGRPKFMGTFKDDEKKNILSYLGNKENATSIAELLEQKKQSGLLYDFQYDYASYYSYVNPLCQIASRYLGIQDKKINGTKLDTFRWENFANEEFKNYFSATEVIAFYLDSETQISESFGNDTTKSVLADNINSLSELGREMQFLLGGDNGPQFDFLKKQNYDSTSEAFQSWMKNNISIIPSTLINRLTEGGLNIVTGGKMIFPEIWADSSFSKSYGVKLKLRSPDCDDFSIYMNILVPLFHLISLVAPQSKGNTSYNSPFLVKAYYKSIFNCNMGIITDMGISTSKWNAKGLPIEVDVDFSIKDLYQLLTITSQSVGITDKYSIDVLSNTLLMDYIANKCGVNVNKPDILRTIDLYLTQIYDRKSISARIDNGLLKLEQSLTNNLGSLAGVFKLFNH